MSACNFQSGLFDVSIVAVTDPLLLIVLKSCHLFRSFGYILILRCISIFLHHSCCYPIPSILSKFFSISSDSHQDISLSELRRHPRRVAKLPLTISSFEKSFMDPATYTNRKKQEGKGQPGVSGSSSSKELPRPKKKARDLSVVILDSARPRGLKNWGLFFRRSRDAGSLTLINWSMMHYKLYEEFNVDPTENPRFEQEIFVGPVDLDGDPCSYENRVKKTKLQVSDNWNCQDWVLDVLERLCIHNNIEGDMYSQALRQLRKVKQSAFSTQRS